MFRRELVASLVVLLGLASVGSAATVTFAQVQQQNPALKAFRFTNNNSGVRQFTASVPVLFSYSATLFPGLRKFGLLGGQNAVLTLNGTTTAPATATGVGTTASPRVFTQILENVVLSIKLVTPHKGLNNLLTATFTDTLSGIRGGSTATLRSDTQTGDALIYTSDFLDFSRTVDRDLSFSFTSLTSANNGQTGADFSGAGFRLRRDANRNDFLRSFTAAGVGTFATNPPPIVIVPEPGSFALMGFCLITLATLSRRYQR